MSILASKKVVTRIAPSPTGHLHIGTARTALFNFLYARSRGGMFIIRTEDTDKERSKPEYEQEILDGLAWLGLEHDAFYRQSERSAIYRHYLEKIISADKAYVSREESKNNPGTFVEVVRLKNPNTTITFDDEIRGEIAFDTTELGDFVIARSIDDALYHFTVVVDDHEMGVTHVIRGDDHISNTPRQILIQEAIGATRPHYAHLPLILAPDRSKLSKRHGAVMLDEYRKDGFLKESILNYLMLLGWSPATDQEIFTIEECLRIFDISGIQKGGAIFDIEKLKWFNREYLKHYSDDDYARYASEAIVGTLTTMPQYSDERFLRLLPTIRERVSTSGEIHHACRAGEYDYFFDTPTVSQEMLKWKHDTSAHDALPRLQHVAEFIAQMPENVSVEEAKNALWNYAEEKGKGEVLWPLRVALSGRERSPDPFTLIHILGSGESYKRVRTACDIIRSSE
ncbi:MAG TPA: glutamate--tRNA ligase [Candidatus Paceibacterota bacterium]|nr:glutamate--tRNA ligase [Candidatus Paceibacterota bacterium]